MGYNTKVLIYDNKLSPDKALELTLAACEMFKTFNVQQFKTDTHTVTKLENGYRITKNYKVDMIERCHYCGYPFNDEEEYCSLCRRKRVI